MMCVEDTTFHSIDVLRSDMLMRLLIRKSKFICLFHANFISLFDTKKTSDYRSDNRKKRENELSIFRINIFSRLSSQMINERLL